jgi:hypothetical protein
MVAAKIGCLVWHSGVQPLFDSDCEVFGASCYGKMLHKPGVDMLNEGWRLC